MSIQMKGDIYYVVLMYRDAANRKKYKWIRAGTSIKEAQRMERNLRTDMERGEITFSKKTSLETFLYQWLDIVIKPNKRASTYDNYKYQIQNISKGIGNVELSKLKAPQIQTHYNSELQRPLKKDDKGNVLKTMTPTSVRLQHSILKMALDKAVEWQLIPKNPCDFTEPPQKNKPKNAAFTPEQVETMMAIAEDTNLYIPVLLGFLCGLRRGEICGLRWSDIDLKERFAEIHNSLDRISKDDAVRLKREKKIVWFGCESEDGKSVLALGPVKTEESENDIPIPGIVVDALEKEKQVQELHKEQFGPSYQKHDFVWVWEDGRPHDPDYLYHAFKKMIKRHNKSVDANPDIPEEEKENHKLPVIRPHDMRHTHATLLLEKNVDVKVVSKKLRHKRASFTGDYYQHVRKKVSQVTADAMDELFGTKETG